MTDVVIATSETDARAAEAVEEHHAQMSGTLTALVERLVAAAGRADVADAREARTRLEAWCRDDLLPHALAEERTLYPAARRTVEGRLLVEGMVSEHRVIEGLVRSLTGVDDPVRAAANATALRALFEAHVTKENDLLVPLLLRTPGASVADLLGGMRELLGSRAGTVHDLDREDETTGGCGEGHTCSCGETDPVGYPELDARSIPHAIRHATIFGALAAVEPGSGLVLLAPHDPLPLLAQIADRWPGRFGVDYFERGPQTWRLALERSDARQ
jgi:uncharacterized protein (DUF2249 family)/iron-sulfur cluster repair protein YtfE (RIC family)